MSRKKLFSDIASQIKTDTSELKRVLQTLPHKTLIQLSNLPQNECQRIINEIMFNETNDRFDNRMIYGVEVSGGNKELGSVGRVIVADEDGRKLIEKQIVLESALSTGLEALSDLKHEVSIYKGNGNNVKLSPSYLSSISSKVGMEARIEPSVESISSAMKSIIDAVHKALEKLMQWCKDFFNWLRNLLKKKQNNKNEVLKKITHTVSLLQDNEVVTIEVKNDIVNLLTPPGSDTINPPEAIAGWVNTLNDLISDKTNDTNINRLIDFDFENSINNPDAPGLNVLIKPPFNDCSVFGKDKSKNLIDYVGSKLSGDIQLCASLPDMDAFDMDNDVDRDKFLKALSLSRFGVIPFTRDIKVTKTTLELNKSDINLLVTTYESLNKTNLQVLNVLEHLQDQAVKVKNKLTEIKSLLNKYSDSDQETKMIVSELYQFVFFIAKTFREPLTTVARKSCDIEDAMCSLVDQVNSVKKS
jgi:hypothetical protein